jgi:uncharacterized membrane protein
MATDDLAYKTDAELKADAKQQLAGKWGDAILACVVYSIVVSAAAGAAGIGNLIVGGPMEFGLAAWFLSLKRNGAARLEDLFRGFRSIENTIVAYIVRTIYVALWSLLFIVPGIIAALRYSMVFYILHDDPGLSAMEAMRRSREMTEGYKSRLFGLYLSFLGWALLGVLTLGIGYFWLVPYVKATEANFYEALKATRSGAVPG